MRKLSTIFAAVLVSAVPSLSQTTSGPSSAWAENIFMKKTVHDFGTVAHGAQLKHTFPIKNIYAVPLNLTISKVSCGCVTATLTKKVLQPLEEGALEVNMDSSFPGPKSNVNISITVGPEYISTAVIKVSATARSDVVFNPGEVNFGVVAQGQQPVQTIDVEYAGVLDFRIKEVNKQESAPFSVVMEEKYRTQPVGKQPGRVGYRMTVKLASDAPAGVLKHDLVLKTNDPASEVLIVSVDGTVQSPLRVAPDSVNFGPIKVGETKTFRVQVQGSRPFRITSIKADGAEITADLPPQAQPAHTLTLRCQPTTLGEFRRTVTIFTDLDKGAGVTVSVQATGTQ